MSFGQIVVNIVILSAIGWAFFAILHATKTGEKKK